MTMTDWEAYAESHRQNARSMTQEPCQQLRSETMGRRAKGTTLDVGGGDGYQAAYMAAEGAQVTVLDVSVIRCVRASEAGFETIVGDAEDLDLPDDSYDTVMLGEILEHLDRPGDAVAEAFRVARERVVISLPLNGWSDPTHRWRISLDECYDPDDPDPTKGNQIVLTFQRGTCWPSDYWETDPSWHTQMVEGR